MLFVEDTFAPENQKIVKNLEINFSQKNENQKCKFGKIQQIKIEPPAEFEQYQNNQQTHFKDLRILDASKKIVSAIGFSKGTKISEENFKIFSISFKPLSIEKSQENQSGTESESESSSSSSSNSQTETLKTVLLPAENILSYTESPFGIEPSNLEKIKKSLRSCIFKDHSVFLETS